MKSDVIELRDLYDFVRRNRKRYQAMNLMSAASRPYSKLCKEAAKDVAESQGFYLWGYYEKTGLWRNVYLGKAGHSKRASLRKRILEELKDERCCVWRAVHSETRLLQLVRKVHSNRSQWEKITRYWKRSLGKAGTTHIIWVETPQLSNSDVKRIESDLIEAMNPRANRQRPAPPIRVLQKDTADIFRLLREEIHEHRPKSK